MQNKYSAPNTQVETATCFDSFFVAGFCVCVCGWVCLVVSKCSLFLVLSFAC